MSFLSDVGKFKLFEGKKILREIRENPWRLAVGSADPASTRMWNGITGRHDEPLVDQMGGTTGKTMHEMDKAGINTGPGRKMEGLAHVVAAIIAGNYAAGAMGGGAGGMPATGGAEAGGELLVDTGGMGMGQIGAGAGQTTPALLESQIGTAGYGASSAGPGGASAGAASGGGAMSRAGNAMQNAGSRMQQQEDQRERVEADPVMLTDPRAYERDYATSSRTTKNPARGARMQAEVLEKGASGADPISQNGVQIASIQALTQRIAHARARLAQLKKQRGTHEPTR